MRPDQWDRARQLFAEALSRPEGDRGAFLQSQCSDDAEVLRETEALLGHQSDSFLDRDKLFSELRRATPDALPGRIAGFRILREVGRGGMGIVYEAEQEMPVRRKVAIKVIRAGMSTDQVVARFSTERQALAVMNHPGIARVFDAGAAEDGRPYFVMEFVEGKSITEFCDAARLHIHRRLQLFMQVCEAVQHAHQKGIIHRDLKPSNILVSEQEGHPAPKIIDFGIAKATDKSFTEATMLTELGQIVGTLGYMSPEQARMTGQGIDTRTDVYSLGVILYELLVGSPPFDPKPANTAFDEILREIRETDPPRPSVCLRQLGSGSIEVARNRQAEPGAYLRDLAGDLDWIVMRALEKEPDRRYTSASELAADVQRYLLNEPVIARPPGTRYRIGKFIRRHRVGAALTGVIILSLIGGIFGTTFALVRAREAEADARAAEAVAKTENESFEKITRELAEMFKDADPRRTGRNITARELLDFRAQAIDESLGDEPRAAGRIMLAMARAYRSIGAYPEAKAMFERALPLLESAYGRQHETVFDSLNEMGILASELLDLDAAEKHLREALRIAEALHGPDHEDVAPVLKNLADTLIKLGRPKEAEPYLTRSTEIRTRVFGSDHIIVAKNLSTLGSLLIEIGDAQRAVEVARRSLEIRDAYWKEEPGHPDIGFGHYYMGEAQAAAGLHEEAIASFRSAREFWERSYGPNHPNVGECSYQAARALQELGRVEEAYDELSRARRAMEAGLDADDPSTAASLAVWLERFADLLRGLGRQGEAGRLAERAASLRERHGLLSVK